MFQKYYPHGICQLCSIQLNTQFQSIQRVIQSKMCLCCATCLRITCKKNFFQKKKTQFSSALDVLCTQTLLNSKLTLIQFKYIFLLLHTLVKLNFKNLKSIHGFKWKIIIVLLKLILKLNTFLRFETNKKSTSAMASQIFIFVF